MLFFFCTSPRRGHVLGMFQTPIGCEVTQWSSEMSDGYLWCPDLLLCFWLLTSGVYIVPQSQKGGGSIILNVQAFKLSLWLTTKPKAGFPFISSLNINFSLWLENTWIYKRESVLPIGTSWRFCGMICTQSLVEWGLQEEELLGLFDKVALPTV